MIDWDKLLYSKSTESRIREVVSGCEFVSMRRHGPYKLVVLLRDEHGVFFDVTVEAPKNIHWVQAQLEAYLVGKVALEFASRNEGPKAVERQPAEISPSRP